MKKNEKKGEEEENLRKINSQCTVWKRRPTFFHAVEREKLVGFCVFKSDGLFKYFHWTDKRDVIYEKQSINWWVEITILYLASPVCCLHKKYLLGIESGVFTLIRSFTQSDTEYWLKASILFLSSIFFPSRINCWTISLCYALCMNVLRVGYGEITLRITMLKQRRAKNNVHFLAQHINFRSTGVWVSEWIIMARSVRCIHIVHCEHIHSGKKIHCNFNSCCWWLKPMISKTFLPINGICIELWKALQLFQQI